jgi:hypothetical protein
MNTERLYSAVVSTVNILQTLLKCVSLADPSLSVTDSLVRTSLMKFPIFYGNRSFITVFNESHHWHLFWPDNAVHTFQSNSSNIHSNIILPSCNYCLGELILVLKQGFHIFTLSFFLCSDRDRNFNLRWKATLPYMENTKELLAWGNKTCIILVYKHVAISRHWVTRNRYSQKFV